MPTTSANFDGTVVILGSGSDWTQEVRFADGDVDTFAASTSLALGDTKMLVLGMPGMELDIPPTATVTGIFATALIKVTAVSGNATISFQHITDADSAVGNARTVTSPNDGTVHEVSVSGTLAQWGLTQSDLSSIRIAAWVTAGLAFVANANEMLSYVVTYTLPGGGGGVREDVRLAGRRGGSSK